MRSCRDAIRLKPKPKDALVRLKVGKIKQQGPAARVHSALRTSLLKPLQDIQLFEDCRSDMTGNYARYWSIWRWSRSRK